MGRPHDLENTSAALGRRPSAGRSERSAPPDAGDQLAGLRSELEARERELQLLKEQLEATQASLSWRVTAPLRTGKGALRSLLQRRGMVL